MPMVIEIAQSYDGNRREKRASVFSDRRPSRIQGCCLRVSAVNTQSRVISNTRHQNAKTPGRAPRATPCQHHVNAKVFSPESLAQRYRRPAACWSFWAILARVSRTRDNAPTARFNAQFVMAIRGRAIQGTLNSSQCTGTKPQSRRVHTEHGHRHEYPTPGKFLWPGQCSGSTWATTSMRHFFYQALESWRDITEATRGRRSGFRG